MTNTISAGKKLTVLGVPFAGGQGKSGVDEAPKMFEAAGLGDELRALGWEPTWNHLEFQHISEEDDARILNMRRPRYVAGACHHIFDEFRAAAANSFVLTLGGDHSIGMSTVTGALAQHPDAVVLWIDAHADLNSAARTESGNIHGCPVAFATGIDGVDKLAPKEDVFSWIPRGSLDFSRLAYIGLRDVDEFEKQVIREQGITAFSMHEVDKYGIGKVVEMALEKVNPGNKRPIHLSFDVDALDPFFAPSTGTPVRGGLTWREGCYICEAVAETGQLVSMDLVETNPHLGENEANVKETLNAGIALIRSALGQTLL